MDRVPRAFHHLVGFLRKTRTSRASTAKRSNEHETSSASRSSRERHRTAANALELTLTTFNSISRGIPGAGALSGIIEPLLEITKRIEQTAINAEGLAALEERIQDLTPVVTRTLLEGCPHKAQLVVERLRKALGWIMQDLEVAHSQGKLSQFFNSTDNAAFLERHYKVLDRLVNDFTMIMGLERAGEDRKVAMELHTIHALLELQVPSSPVSPARSPDQHQVAAAKARHRRPNFSYL
ncbi:hypothetical protein K438DRAFT_1781407 [Mycena galopus ATCC 62051]|nr:hypothetical protein K438DRAFT_1781407 [Mycena galopus ATCC 62051]